LDPRPYGLKRREVCGTKFFYLLGRILGFLAFLPINLIELITEIEDLAIGLRLSLITSYDADDLLCQFGSIALLTLRTQRQGADYQNRNFPSPVSAGVDAPTSPVIASFPQRPLRAGEPA
jgi:hypothetical protein